METPASLRVIKRDKSLAEFDPNKIVNAITSAFISAEGSALTSTKEKHSQIENLAAAVCTRVARTPDRNVSVEDVQDQVELALMRAGLQNIARRYVIYREEQAERRERESQEKFELNGAPVLTCLLPDESTLPLDFPTWSLLLEQASMNLPDVSPELIFDNAAENAYLGITVADFRQLLVMAAREKIEEEPSYSYMAARLQLEILMNEAFPGLGVETRSPTCAATCEELAELYPALLARSVSLGIRLERLNPELDRFDLELLGSALCPQRDFAFNYLGLQTLYDRYFLHDRGVRFELPQIFFMRVAMGISLNESNPNERAMEFYKLLSSFDFMNSTPTLFNSGTLRSQLSSCYLTTVSDSLEGICQAQTQNAMLSKWAGGLGNDWTPIRALGSHIKGTNGESQGVIPFLKVINDTAVAVNQGGKRKGAVCSYLETWHLDIEEFLELRKNTGDDRRRTHDMNTANWIPDLFMERVLNNDSWTLFSPSDVPHLHDLFGTEFREAYEEAERSARSGDIPLHKVVDAEELWRKILAMLYETGHPWITFKDPSNLRSPQQHTGVVHSSNLCTEITLNTSETEIAVCNLGSINLAQHLLDAGGVDHEKLRSTVRTAVRMLDNVIDINYYAVEQAKTSNALHRPIGLGMMGFQDALYAFGIPYASEAAVQFADESMEAISWYAIEASADLAQERGSYKSFDGSLWSQGLIPLDSLSLLAKSRRTPDHAHFNTAFSMDWDHIRQRVRKGMRNSNVLAIAPTATIANIVGVTPSIEPMYQNLFVKSNLSGDFTVVNPRLIASLKSRQLWGPVLAYQLKCSNGSVQELEVPDEVKRLFCTSFEIDPIWLVRAAARRQKWIDQSQSLNLYFPSPDGRKLDQVYKDAWRMGLKTTYYLRALAATQTERSTVIDDHSLAAVQRADRLSSEETMEPMAACLIDDPDCEACQ